MEIKSDLKSEKHKKKERIKHKRPLNLALLLQPHGPIQPQRDDGWTDRREGMKSLSGRTTDEHASVSLNLGAIVIL